MIKGSINLGDFVLDEPAVYYWVDFVNEGILADDGFRTFFLDDIYYYQRIDFDNAADDENDDRVDSLDGLPLEALYNAMYCIGCGFEVTVTTGYFTENPRQYVLYFYPDEDVIEIIELKDGEVIDKSTKTFDKDDDFIDDYRERYEEWLEYDGEVKWEG